MLKDTITPMSIRLPSIWTRSKKTFCLAGARSQALSGGRLALYKPAPRGGRDLTLSVPEPPSPQFCFA